MCFVVAMRRSGVNGTTKCGERIVLPQAVDAVKDSIALWARAGPREEVELYTAARWTLRMPSSTCDLRSRKEGVYAVVRDVEGSYHCKKRCFSASPGTKQAPSSPGPPLPCRSRRTTAWKPTRMIRCWQSSRRILLTLVLHKLHRGATVVSAQGSCRRREALANRRRPVPFPPGLRVHLPHTRGFS